MAATGRGGHGACFGFEPLPQFECMPPSADGGLRLIHAVKAEGRHAKGFNTEDGVLESVGASVAASS